MAKLTFAVAALVAVSFAGTRVQAQSEQLATVDEMTIVQDAPAQDAQVPAVEVQVAQAPETQVADVPAPVVENTELQVAVADVPATEAVPVVADAPMAGPTLQAAALSPRLASSSALATHAMRRPSRGSGVGLMIFGGAALITGLIIGDDAGTVIAVGGALVGLYGLYVYLGRPTGMEHGEASHSQRIGLGYKLNTN